jgi:uncharacterized protein with HEPN domain
MGTEKRPLAALIADIRGWIEQGIEIASRGNGREFGSQTDSHAGNWCVLCVGEAAGKVLKSYPDFAEGDLKRELSMASLTRNRIVHGYYNLDAEVILDTIMNSFPVLLSLLNKELPAVAN